MTVENFGTEVFKMKMTGTIKFYFRCDKQKYKFFHYIYEQMLQQHQSRFLDHIRFDVGLKRNKCSIAFKQ